MRFTASFSTALALAAGAHAVMPAKEVVMNVNKITDISSDTNDIASSLGVTNVFQKAPQVVKNFKEIITTVSQDITAMNNDKRSLKARQECLDVTDVEKCIQDLGDIIEDPSEILGRRQLPDIEGIIEDPSEILGRRQLPDVEGIAEEPTQVLGRKRQNPPPYTDDEQNQVCGAFREFVRVHQALLNTVIGKHGLLSLTPFTKPVAAVLRTLEGGVDTIAFAIIDLVPTCAEGATNDKNKLDMTLKEAQDKYN
ncbi:hypothetical protein N7492_009924 [Penicillium capsulatum]|uniref:Cell wall galactomannoprotein n=1 Tax=Penicillium capsulatum TaxID=69766 RepID=A0A9W9LEG9_9EURO|nr:hypothetical protein N7492_009924 [Penicillium capsulatum]KAJ6112435.1 hypothetical protein N7512_007759 [Penicillium capsulatum]